MDPDKKAWLVRAGSLLIILGIFFPSVLVSCTGWTDIQRSYSLLDIVSQLRSNYSVILLLYLIPLGAIATLVFSFIPPSFQFSKIILLFVQTGGLLAGVLGGAIAMLTLASDLSNYSMQPTPEFGAFVFLIGYLMAGAGLAFQWIDLLQQPVDVESFPRETEIIPGERRSRAPGLEQVGSSQWCSSELEQASSVPPPVAFVPQMGAACHLLLAKPDGTYSEHGLRDGFQIGRSRENQLVLNDLSVSRHHAVIRNWQGTWFIQDKESASGIYVNQLKVSATRLQNNDNIQIGKIILIFKGTDTYQ